MLSAPGYPVRLQEANREREREREGPAEKFGGNTESRVSLTLGKKGERWREVEGLELDRFRDGRSSLVPPASLLFPSFGLSTNCQGPPPENGVERWYA